MGAESALETKHINFKTFSDGTSKKIAMLSVTSHCQNTLDQSFSDCGTPSGGTGHSKKKKLRIKNRQFSFSKCSYIRNLIKLFFI
jgi:hypothetical protein